MKSDLPSGPLAEAVLEQLSPDARMRLQEAAVGTGWSELFLYQTQWTTCLVFALSKVTWTMVHLVSGQTANVNVSAGFPLSFVVSRAVKHREDDVPRIETNNYTGERLFHEYGFPGWV